MDDNAKNASSYHLDQEILDARGIDMTVEEVAGLPTVKYSVRVQALRLGDEDLAFLKGLRRRIKNRLASQNSRRRSMEHLRRLSRELRAVRARRDDAIAERKALQARRGELRDRCLKLRAHVVETLRDRLDTTEVPQIDVDISESQVKPKDKEDSSPQCDIERELNVFECRIDKLVQQSVNHLFKSDKKKVFAKTVFLNDDKKKETRNASKRDSTDVCDGGKLDKSILKIEKSIGKVDKSIAKSEKINSKSDKMSVKTESLKFDADFVKMDSGIANFESEILNNDSDYNSRGYHNSDVKSVVFKDYGGVLGVLGGEGEVLNLSVKEGRRKSHGRKQSAPRRITYVEYEVSADDVLDLKVKKEPQ